MTNCFGVIYKEDPLLQVIECGYSGNQFYRLYSDGYCIQGASNTRGFNTFPSGTTITLLKPYKDTSYTIIGPGFVISNYGQSFITSKTTTGFAMTHSSLGHQTEVQSWFTVGWCAI